ncbi:MarR family winged helix-turn-helix transcriptional regulator [Roseomonas sp. GCM10028921]
MLSRLVDTSVNQDLGLTSRQWRVLVVLNRHGPMTSGEVARIASYDHSQVSRTAFELVSKGLIAQADDAGDRRRQVLSLTQAGIELLGAGLVGSLERGERLRASLTEAECEVFCRAVAVLTEEGRTMVAERKSERPER